MATTIANMIIEIKTDTNNELTGFADSVFLTAINRGIEKTAQLIANAYLPNLIALQFGFNLPSNQTINIYDGGNLNHNNLRGNESILSVVVDDVVANQIELSDKKLLEITAYSGSSTSPVFYIEGDVIYIKAGGSATLANITYLRKPNTALVGDTSIDLKPELEDIVINFANAKMFIAGNDKRSAIANKIAMDLISVYNNRVIPKTSLGQGGIK